mgnify:CR=1 FL=1
MNVKEKSAKIRTLQADDTYQSVITEITNQLKVLASETFSSVSSPIQYAAIAAHKNDHANYINHSKNILKSVGNYVYENLKSNNVLINNCLLYTSDAADE